MPLGRISISSQLGARVIGACAMLTSLMGCAVSGPVTSPTPSGPTLRVAHHAGGRHHRTMVVQGTWLQTIDASLAVIDPVTLEVVSSLQLAEPGRTGAAVDMVLFGRMLYVALEWTGAAVVDLRSPSAPQAVSLVSAAELGVQPSRVSAVGGDIFFSGRGGVVRWSDRRRFLADQGEVGRVAVARDGLVASVGRRVLRLDSGAYVGAASELINPGGADDSARTELAFVLADESGASYGRMSSDIREVDRSEALEPVRAARVFSGRLWIVTDSGIRSASLIGPDLDDEYIIHLHGVRDIAPLDGSRVVVAGDFGRAVAWIENQRAGPGWLIDSMMPVAGEITLAWSDGRRVIAASAGGAWAYDGVNDPEPAETMGVALSPPSTSAAARWGHASIGAGGAEVIISTAARDVRFSDEDSNRFTCLAVISGDLWIGHERGITALRVNDDGEPAVLDRLRLDGPVSFLFPTIDARRVMYVTRHGQFGIMANRP